MNLLQLLLGSYTSNDSLNSVSQKTGVSSSLVSKLLIAAIPMLLAKLTSNASSSSGLSSLLGALGQHNSNQTVSQQVASADLTDGAKIIAHILGSNQKETIASLAKQTGLTQKQVTAVLNAIAPSLLSSLNTATTTAQTQASHDTIDLSSLANAFGATQQSTQSSTSAVNGLLGSLLGGGSTQQQQTAADPMSSLLGSLLGGGTTQQQQTSTAGNLLGSLLGGGSTQQQASSAVDGSQLLGLLTGLLK